MDLLVVLRLPSRSVPKEGIIMMPWFLQRQQQQHCLHKQTDKQTPFMFPVEWRSFACSF